MKIRDLITVLVQEHAAIVSTEYHIQVPCVDRYHDIWVGGREGLKWKLQGMRETDSGSPESLLAELGRYQAANTDLAWSQRLTRFLKSVEGKTGVWVDAGWKNGIARMAAVRILTDGMDICVRTFAVATSHDAEVSAVEFAAHRWAGETIHTDSQHAASVTGAVWVPRKQNKMADSLGNRRN